MEVYKNMNTILIYHIEGSNAYHESSHEYYYFIFEPLTKIETYENIATKIAMIVIYIIVAS